MPCEQAHFDAVELGRLQVPQFDRAQIVKVQGVGSTRLSAGHGQLLRRFRHQALAVVKRGLERQRGFMDSTFCRCTG